MLKYKDETIGIGKVDLSEINTKLSDNADYLKKENILDYSQPFLDASGYTTKGVTFTYNENKVITLNGTLSSNTSGGLGVVWYSNFSNGTYIATILNATTKEIATDIAVSNGSNKNTSKMVFTVDSTTSSFPVCISPIYEKTYNGQTYIIEIAEYSKSNVQLTNELKNVSNANDELKMLGWTVPSECPIQNNTDANGVFHQRVGRVDMGSLTWTLFKAESNIFSTSITGIQNTKYALMYSNIYNLANDKSVSEFANMDMRSSGNSAVVFIRNTSYSDADTFKSAMAGQYLYYELATEITKSDGNEIGTNLCGFISPSKIASIQVDANWDSSNRTISYTATENCFVVGRFATNGTNLSINVKIDDYLIQRLGHVVTNAIVHENPITIPLRKGQVFKIEVSITNGSTFASLNAVKMI